MTTTDPTPELSGERGQAHPRLAAAIVDRLTFNAHILETGSDSYRLRTTRKKNAAKRS